MTDKKKMEFLVLSAKGNRFSGSRILYSITIFHLQQKISLLVTKVNFNYETRHLNW